MRKDAQVPDPEIVRQGNERARLQSINEWLRMRNRWLDARADHERNERAWGVRSADRQIAKIDARLAELGHVIGDD